MKNKTNSKFNLLFSDILSSIDITSK